MTKEQALVIILESAVQQAISTVEFLDGCLTDPEANKYTYPEQTQTRLRLWRALVPERKLCVHSGYEQGCPGCADRIMRMTLLAGAHERLNAS